MRVRFSCTRDWPAAWAGVDDSFPEGHRFMVGDHVDFNGRFGAEGLHGRWRVNQVHWRWTTGGWEQHVILAE